MDINKMLGFPNGSDSKESAFDAGDLGSIPELEDPLKKDWLPTPVFVPGESRRQRSLVGCSPWSWKVLDTTEQLPLSLSREAHYDPAEQWILNHGGGLVSLSKSIGRV